MNTKQQRLNCKLRVIVYIWKFQILREAMADQVDAIAGDEWGEKVPVACTEDSVDGGKDDVE